MNLGSSAICPSRNCKLKLRIWKQDDGWILATTTHWATIHTSATSRDYCLKELICSPHDNSKEEVDMFWGKFNKHSDADFFGTCCNIISVGSWILIHIHISKCCRNWKLWRLHSLTWSALEQVFKSNSEHDFYMKKSRSNALVPLEIKWILNYFISRTIMNTSLMTSFMVNHPCNYFCRSIIRCCEPCKVARLWVFQPWGLIWSGKAHKFLFMKASTLVNVIRPLINCVFCSWCCAALVLQD